MVMIWILDQLQVFAFVRGRGQDHEKEEGGKMQRKVFISVWIGQLARKLGLVVNWAHFRNEFLDILFCFFNSSIRLGDMYNCTFPVMERRGG